MSNLGALDMALDDVISQNRTNKRSTSNTGGRRGGSSRGGISKNRPSENRYPNRQSSLSLCLRVKKPYNGASRPARNNTPLRTSRPASSNTRASNSLVVANLHFNVTEKDLYDLFGQIGKLKRAFLHIGPNGKSSGIADVVFVSSQDAERARNTYNNVELDGRPMRISTASIISAVSSAPSSNAGRRSGNLRGGNNSGRRGGSAKREFRSKPNQRDLDADMDSYMGNNEDVQMN
ncbi:hypothetical protein [Parasitella parasitica]|uniref:RRM domain-containing protein n=1 Tax=Parasitella parasitica TaxID=35722 RepID=A0A0B7NMY4_9FUNG|nr:hypothetical protein [Parasitella parasitica]